MSSISPKGGLYSSNLLLFIHLIRIPAQAFHAPVVTFQLLFVTWLSVAHFITVTTTSNSWPYASSPFSLSHTHIHVKILFIVNSSSSQHVILYSHHILIKVEEEKLTHKKPWFLCLKTRKNVIDIFIFTPLIVVKSFEEIISLHKSPYHSIEKWFQLLVFFVINMVQSQGVWCRFLICPSAEPLTWGGYQEPLIYIIQSSFWCFRLLICIKKAKRPWHQTNENLNFTLF